MNAELFAIPTVVAVSASLVAGLTDVWRFKVYNLLTFPLAAAALVFHTSTEGASGTLYSAGGLAFALVVLLLPYSVGMIGAGDVKFMAAIGAWLGANQLWIILVVGALTTGVFSLLVIARRSGWRGLALNFRLLGMRLVMMAQGLWLSEDQLETVQSVARSPERRHRLIPFSAMMALAVILTVAYRIATRG